MDDYIFGRIKDIYWNTSDGLVDFVNVLLEKTTWGRSMLPDLSDIYVLVTIKDMRVLAYMEIKKRKAPDGFAYIEVIDTLEREKGYAVKIMMEYCRKEGNVPLPYEIIWDSRLYWKRYFEDINLIVEEWDDEVVWDSLYIPLSKCRGVPNNPKRFFKSIKNVES